MRKIEFSKRYLKSLKKLDKNEQAEVNALIKRLANDENLELTTKTSILALSICIWRIVIVVLINFFLLNAIFNFRRGDFA